VVGFSLAGAASAGRTSATGPTVAGYNPDLTQVDSFLVVHPDNTVDILWGQPEWGHGAYSGISQMVAEELNLDMRPPSSARPAPRR
jgi:isoquinoline 1-oxidoreductase beta subunit